MLNLYVYSEGYYDEPDNREEIVPKDLPLIIDVEAEFSRLHFTVDSIIYDLVKSIDDCKMIDDTYCYDRFDTQIYTSNLSTGSKAGILVYCTNKVIDLIECGLNAIAAILSFCPNGYVALPRLYTTFSDLNLNTTYKRIYTVNGDRADSFKEMRRYVKDCTF